MSMTPAGFTAAFTAAMQAALGTAGGAELGNISTAMGTGIINTAIILTGQIGSPAGAGASTGLGISLTATNVGDNFVAEGISAWGQEGDSSKDFGDALGTALVSEFGSADLTSDANGSCGFISFKSAKAAMASAIQAAASGPTGPEWPNFCTAVANAICDEVGDNGSGSLSGAPGGGPGSGVVVIA